MAHRKIWHLATYRRIITFATGISMEESRIQGFHVYQDNWTPILGQAT